MVEVSTSILGVNEDNSIQTFYNLEVAHTDYFHIDVMDGEFVENNTEEKMYKYAQYIKQISNTPIDVHLMVKDVKEKVMDYIDLKPNIITFHIEAVNDKKETLELIKYIKENNCRVGLSIKPDTDISKLYDYLPFIHLVLVMTVEPGKGGQKLIPKTLENIKQIYNYINKNNIEIDIEADGGINLDTINLVKKAGANIIVAGTAIIESNDYGDVIKRLKE